MEALAPAPICPTMAESMYCMTISATWARMAGSARRKTKEAPVRMLIFSSLFRIEASLAVLFIGVIIASHALFMRVNGDLTCIDGFLQYNENEVD